MDESRFDWLARTFGERRTRRGAVALLAAASSWPLLDSQSAEARKKKKKKKGKNKNKKGGKKSTSCTPQCSGCGGGDGCGGTCGCNANQICDSGTCRTCDVTCAGDAVACGSALSQRLADGGTIYVCPGRYQGNFTVGTAKVIGAGKGDNPATNTVLDAAGNGRVVTVVNDAVTELIGLHIKGGKVDGNVGGGVRADAGDLRITNCTITGNEATNGGGGIHSAGAFRLTDSTVSLNTGSNGGGIQLTGTQPTFFTNSIITRNKSVPGNSYGGGLYNFYSNLTMVGTEISSNEASAGAGGIENYIGTITMNAACRVINNTAPTAGGIHNTSGTINLNGATVSGNSAPQCVNVTGCSS